jgi:hypothetical protein
VVKRGTGALPTGNAKGAEGFLQRPESPKMAPRHWQTNWNNIRTPS